jgi:hypothetical protein
MDRMAVLLRDLEDLNGYWLDIGTGDGIFTRLLQRDHPIAMPIQMDKHQYTNQTLLGFLGIIEQLPIRPNSVNGMICAQVLHYTPKSDQFSVLERISLSLVKTGKMIIIAYVRGEKYPWVPHHISEQDIQKYCNEIDDIQLQQIIYDDDRSRPKYAAYIVKL